MTFPLLLVSPDSASVDQEKKIGEYIIHHIKNSNEWNVFGFHLPLPQFEPVSVFGMTIDLSITTHVIMLWIAAITLILVFRLSFKRDRLIPAGFGALLESMILFIRDEVVYSSLGEKEGRRFMPLLCTFFFFILTCNLLGLIPPFSTATGNINVTAALAIITFIAGQFFGMRRQGIVGYFKSLVPAGVPIWLLPLMYIIEIMGLLAKHFAGDRWQQAARQAVRAGLGGDVADGN